MWTQALVRHRKAAGITSLLLLALGVLLIAGAYVYYTNLDVGGFVPFDVTGITQGPAQFVEITSFYQNSCEVKFTDVNGLTTIQSYNPCTFPFSHTDNFRLDIDSAWLNGPVSTLFVTESGIATNAGGPSAPLGGVYSGKKVGVKSGGNLFWYLESYDWNKGWSDRVCQSCGNACSQNPTGPVVACTNNVFPPTSYSCSTTSGGNTCTYNMPAGSRVNAATLTKSCSFGGNAHGCSATCSLSNNGATISVQISAPPEYGGRSCSYNSYGCTGTAVCNFQYTIDSGSTQYGVGNTQCIVAGQATPKLIVGSTDPTKLTCNEGLCWNRATGVGLLQPPVLTRNTQALGSTPSCFTHQTYDYMHGSSSCFCGVWGTNCYYSTPTCYIDGPSLSRALPADAGKTGALYESGCWSDSSTCGPLGWSFNSGTRIKDTGNLFQIEWKSGKAYFSIIDSKFYTEEAKARQANPNVGLKYWRMGNDCPVTNDSVVVTHDFIGGSNTALSLLDPTAWYFCKNLPVLRLDTNRNRMGALNYFNGQNFDLYDQWVKNKSYVAVVPQGEVWEVWYFAKMPSNLLIPCHPEPVPNLPDGSCPPNATMASTGNCFYTPIYNSTAKTCAVTPGIIHKCNNGILDENTLTCSVFPYNYITCPPEATYVIPSTFKVSLTNNYTYTDPATGLIYVINGLGGLEFQYTPKPYCKYIPVPQADCPAGTQYKQGATRDQDRCLYTPNNMTVCPDGTKYNDTVGFCIFNPKIQYFCDMADDPVTGDPYMPELVYDSDGKGWCNLQCAPDTSNNVKQCRAAGQELVAGSSIGCCAGTSPVNNVCTTDPTATTLAGQTTSTTIALTAKQICQNKGWLWFEDTGACIGPTTTTTIDVCQTANAASYPQCTTQSFWSFFSFMPSLNFFNFLSAAPGLTDCARPANAVCDPCPSGWNPSTMNGGQGICTCLKNAVRNGTCPTGYAPQGDPTSTNFQCVSTYSPQTVTCLSGWVYDANIGCYLYSPGGQDFCNRVNGRWDAAYNRCVLAPLDPNNPCPVGWEKVTSGGTTGCKIDRALNETYTCIRGTLNYTTMKCVVPLEADVITVEKSYTVCPVGSSQNPQTGRCETVGQTTYVCNDGTQPVNGVCRKDYVQVPAGTVTDTGGFSLASIIAAILFIVLCVIAGAVLGTVFAKRRR